ncbi:MAG: hypothetical protein JWM60_1143, partial [Solirubrobacterales bacterium]|nr:hypothetical protein [Solirubrobacterales bacterium]
MRLISTRALAVALCLVGVGGVTACGEETKIKKTAEEAKTTAEEAKTEAEEAKGSGGNSEAEDAKKEAEAA